MVATVERHIGLTRGGVIALLGAFFDAISTDRLAANTTGIAHITGFQLTACTTAIIVHRVSVVALLGAAGQLVATNRPASCAHGWTGVSLFQLARTAAAVAVNRISVVARLAGSYLLISADFFRADRGSGGFVACVAALDRASCGAAVSRFGVAVIAALTHDVADRAVTTVFL